MADKIKGITIKIGGDTTGLSKALSGVNSDIRSTQSNLKDVERLLKLDPSNVELLTQKQRLLSDAVGLTSGKLDALKDAERQAEEQFKEGKISQEQYDALKREISNTELKLKDLEEQAAKANTTLQQISIAGDKFQEAGKKIEGAGKSLLPITAAVAGIGTASVAAAASFEEGMSKVEAISGATAEQMEALNEKAIEMGAKTKFSARESADAFTYMAMAGWDAEQMIDGIDGIMSLAAADGLDLATTSDIVTDALTAFGMQASDSAHFADVLAQASSSANTNVSMLGESFKYVAPVAGTLGYSAEDVAVALGLMANAGIKASQAGTSLRTALTNMVKPTESMEGVMSELGIEIENEDGSMKSLAETMDILRDKMGLSTPEMKDQRMAMYESLMQADGLGDSLNGLTEEEKYFQIAMYAGTESIKDMSEAEYQRQVQDLLGINIKKKKLSKLEAENVALSIGTKKLEGLTEAEQASAAATLFGKEAMSGMLNVINASEKDYIKLSKAIEKADGRAGDMADTMMDNLSGSIEQMKGALETLLITAGKKLIPTIKKITDKLTAIIEKISKMDDKTLKIIITVGLLVAAIGPLLITVGKLATGIGAVMKLLPMLSGAMTGLAASGGPILLMVAAIAAMGVAFAAAQEETINYYEEARKLTDAEQENKEKVDSLREAYIELSQSRQGAVNDIQAQSEKENELWKELQNITDENGKVKQGYEDRAGFIVSQLQNALGIEISMTDNIIQNYQDLQSEIDNLIEKKRNEAILNAYQESYTEAIKEQKRARDELFQATQNAETAAKDYNEALAKEVELQEKCNDAREKFAQNYTDQGMARYVGELNDQLSAAKETAAGFKERMDESNQTMAKAKEAVEGFNATIANYEGASAAIISGDRDKISQSIMLLQHDFKIMETATAESLQAQHETIKTKLAEMKRAMAEGSPAVTDEMIKEWEQLELQSRVELGKLAITAGDAAKDMAGAVKEKRTDMELAGTDFAGGLAEGITKGGEQVTEAAGNVADAGVAATREALDSHSPSRVTHDIGRDFSAGFAGGIAEGADEVTEAVSQVAAGAAGGLEGQLQKSGTVSSGYQKNIKTSWTTWAADLTSTISACLSRTESNHKTTLERIEQLTTKTLQILKELNKTNTTEMKEDSITAMSEMIKGIEAEVARLEQVVRGGYEPAMKYLTDLIPKARTWGEDMVNGYISGIQNKMGELETACQRMAETISDYMHFTRPEKGPLRNYEEWMPHMVEGLAGGIHDNMWKVTDQLKSMTNGMAAEINGNAIADYKVQDLTKIEGLLEYYLPGMRSGNDVVLSDGTLVGKMMPKIDNNISTKQGMRERNG